MKVSVCIPVYGVEKYIERCARSLFEQTMLYGIEFIFVDDCTPDRSMEILTEVLQEYPHRKEQVKIVRHEQNKGLTGARNTALAHASGDYIIHCDSDDWVDAGLYETMYNRAVETGADVVCCGIVLELGTRQKRLNLTGQNMDELFFNAFQTVEFNSLCNKLFARSAALASDLTVPDHIIMAEDLLRTTQMFLKCNKLEMCTEYNYHYLYNNLSSSSLYFSRKAFDASRQVLEILLEKLPEKYCEISEACKGQILFSALRLADFSPAEFKSLAVEKGHVKILFNRYLSLEKRLMLFLALFSYPLARFCTINAVAAVLKFSRG